MKSRGTKNLVFKDSGFGVSQQLENARLIRSREKSLAATIVKFSGVTSAEVHLAIPKQTVFVTDRRRPSASVLLNLACGLGLLLFGELQSKATLCNTDFHPSVCSSACRGVHLSTNVKVFDHRIRVLNCIIFAWFFLGILLVVYM